MRESDFFRADHTVPQARATLGATWICLILSITGGPLLAAESELSSGLARCAQLRETDSRLACFDALAARDTPREEKETHIPSTDRSLASPVPPSEPMSAPQTLSAATPTDSTTTEDSERTFLKIRPYRRNYLLPVAYNDDPNRNVPKAQTIDLPFLGEALDQVEVKFQISFEVPLWTQILNQDLDLYFAYTQLAFFQAYNRKYSSPFRETNYEPELGLYWRPNLEALGWRVTATRLALDHQSNGRSDPLSRSWNRLVGQVQFQHDALALNLRFWTPLGANPSDNPDIYDYLGYGELHLGYDLGKHHLGLMVRNPTRPALQLDWSYPLGETIRLYVQYFNGYGESLLDYDHSVNRIGIGFLVNDWP